MPQAVAMICGHTHTHRTPLYIRTAPLLSWRAVALLSLRAAALLCRRPLAIAIPLLEASPRYFTVCHRRVQCVSAHQGILVCVCRGHTSAPGCTSPALDSDASHRDAAPGPLPAHSTTSSLPCRPVHGGLPLPLLPTPRSPPLSAARGTSTDTDCTSHCLGDRQDLDFIESKLKIRLGCRAVDGADRKAAILNQLRADCHVRPAPAARSWPARCVPQLVRGAR